MSQNKPQAVQFLKTKESRDEVKKFLGDDFIRFSDYNNCVDIDTMDGVIRAEVGNFLIRKEHYLYVCAVLIVASTVGNLQHMYDEVLYKNLAGETETFESTSDERAMNNVMRHEYKALSEAEKQQMQDIKDYGLEFHEYLTAIPGDSRELSLAKTKIEEAVFWAVKHCTG